MPRCWVGQARRMCTAHDATRVRGANLHEIAEVVDNPKATARRLFWFGWIATYQWLGYVSVIVDLAEQRVILAPHSQRVGATAMAQAVGGELVHGEHEVFAAGGL